MLRGTLFPRTIDVPGLGALSRSWFSDHAGKWRGITTAGVTLRLPGSRTGPDPAAVAIASHLLGVSTAPWQDALLAEFRESEAPGLVGSALWRELDVWPYGRGKDGAMALFEVPWDEEHLWGVLLTDNGDVQAVVVSP